MIFFFDRCTPCQFIFLLAGAFFCSIAADFLPEPLDSLSDCFYIAEILLTWVFVVRVLNSTSSGLSPHLRRVVHWVHAQTLELFALIYLLFLGLSALFFKNRPVSSFDNPRPILLVHGYLNAGFVWMFLRKYLSKNGFGPVYTIDLGHPFQSIHSYALKVQQIARQIAQETGCIELTLVGHSMGGLVSCYYAAKFARVNSVLKVITIGSPLFGTRVAKIGLGQCAREMEIGSEFIKEFHDAMEVRGDLQIYNIVSTVDEIVIPYSSAVFQSEPQNQLFIEDIGHISLLFSKRVADQLCGWIAARR